MVMKCLVCTQLQNTSCKALSLGLNPNKTHLTMSQLTSEALQLRLEVSEEDLNTTLHQLTLLKVPQLKELCKSIGLAQKGKKQDLIDRLHQFISSCSRARDRGSLLLAARTIVLKALNNDPVPNFSNLCSVLSTGLIDQQLITGQIARLQNNLGPGAAQRRPYTTQTSQVTNSNVRSSLATQLSAYYPKYQGPMLLFQSTVFYTLRRMVHGFPYVMIASMSRNVCNVPVHLDQDEINLLRQSSTAKVYFFCALSSTSDPNRADIQFPPIEIYVDGVNTKQYVKGLKGKVGTSRPADLTNYIKDFNRQFTINIVYSDAAEPYIVYLYVVDSRTPEDITKMIVESLNFIPSLTTKEAIRKEYELNQDDDIVMATSSISLRCPLSYARMSYPVKSIQCDHIQCFDAVSFLSMQERIPSWICPVCSKKIDQQLLALSKYMEEILQTTTEEVDTVTLNPDGSWVAAEEGAEEAAKPTFQSSSKSAADAPATQVEPANTVDDAIEVISLGSDTEEENEEVTINATPPEPNNLNTSFAIRASEEIPSTSSLSSTAHDEQPRRTSNTIDTNEASVLEMEGIESQPTADAQVPRHISGPTDKSILHAGTDLSSDDEPIQNYSRRKHHIIEDSVANSDKSSSRSILNEPISERGFSNQTCDNSRPKSPQSSNGHHNSAIEDENSHLTNGTRTTIPGPFGQAAGDISSTYRPLVAASHSFDQEQAEKDNTQRDARNLPPIEKLFSGQQGKTISGTNAQSPQTRASEKGGRNEPLPLPLTSGREILTRELSHPDTDPFLIDAMPSSHLDHNTENTLRQETSELSQVPQVLIPHTSQNNWMNLVINPEISPSNAREGSLINTIQNMFSRSTSPNPTVAQQNANITEASQPDHRMAATAGSKQSQTRSHEPPSHQPSFKSYPTSSSVSDSVSNIPETSKAGDNTPSGHPNKIQALALPGNESAGRQSFAQNSGLGTTQTQDRSRNDFSRVSELGSSKADAYRKMVQNTSQLISLYRQMEGRGGQDPMKTHATRKAWMGTDGTISFPRTIQAGKTLQNNTTSEVSASSTWNRPTNLTLNTPDSRTRSLPTLLTQTRDSQEVSTMTSVNDSTAGARYSQSPFDAFREAEQEKQTVRGILGIEVAHDVILPWNSASQNAAERSTGQRNGYAASSSTAIVTNQMSAGSRLLFNLPTLNRTSSTPVVEGSEIENANSSPIGAKRSLSGSSQAEKTWNKRFNKKKFNPNEINDGLVIELDD